MDEQPIASKWVQTAVVDRRWGPRFEDEIKYRWLEIRAQIKDKMGEFLQEHKNVTFCYRERQEGDSFQVHLMGELRFQPLAEGETLLSEITRLRRALLKKDEEIERLNRELGEAWAQVAQEGDEAF